MTQFDVAVVGLGPAGRALAHRLAVRGAKVLALDRAPEQPWRQTYGGWSRQLPGWLSAGAVAAQAPRTVLRAPGERQLPGTYVVLDTAALQAGLDLAGVEVAQEVVTDEMMARLPARHVVDCRGSRPHLGRTTSAGRRITRRPPAQTGFGRILPAAAARPLLAGADAVLMDWRPHHHARTGPGAGWGDEAPSFCYLVPVGQDRVLVEETCLAGDPALPITELRQRLHQRLAGHGVDEALAAAAPSEKVHIPLLAEPSGTDAMRFGSAGPQLNPLSGYSVFPSLRQADALAEQLLRGTPAPAPRSRLRLPALAALTRLDGDATTALFGAFATLSAADQQAVLDPDTGSLRLARALTRQWLAMASRQRVALVRATAGPLPPTGEREG